jgi:opacity protein-like surface antigen
MKRLLLAAALTVLASASARAQENPRGEVFGGFSYLHAGLGPNLYGWDASAAGNLNKWFGIVGEFSGQHQPSGGTVAFPTPMVPALVVASSADLHTLLFGPRFSYRKDKRFTPFAHILPGLAWSYTRGTAYPNILLLPPAPAGPFSDSGTAFAMAIGGGLDMKLTKTLAFRVLQADYLLTRFGGSLEVSFTSRKATQNNTRLTTGLEYRFGFGE